MINFAVPSVTQKEITEVVKVLKSGWLTTGNKTEKFNNAIKKYIGAKYCLSVSSCTAALHLALLYADISPGDEIVTTPFTFVSTINSILYLGAKPVFVDIKDNDFILDEQKIEEKITPKTKAILTIHYAGFSADLTKLKKIANKYKLALIEDAAHAFGSKYKNEFIGSKSKFCCFSFYPTKNITTIEGGALVTNDKNVFEKASILALHGISKTGWKRYSQKGSWRYDVLELGYKYNLSDVAASIGLAQMQRIKFLKEKREQIYKIYSKELGNIQGLEILSGNSYSQPFRHLFVVKIASAKISRDRFINEMKKRSIICSVHFIPVYRFSYYKNLYNIGPVNFPQTEKAYQQCVSLPFSSSMKINEAHSVVEAIREVIR